MRSGATSTAVPVAVGWTLAGRLNKVFGKWIDNVVKKKAVTAELLSSLAPYAHLPAGELEIIADLAETVTLKQGLVTDELPQGELLFLLSGGLQIQTRHNAILRLSADSPQALYPIPRRPRVASLFVHESAKLLCLPQPVQPVAHAGKGDDRVRPELSPEEKTALESLRERFRSSGSDLPSLPDLALKIGKAIDNPNNTNEDIARLIQLDPALAARLLAVVNSAAFGGVSKISSINQAAGRLGRNKVRSLVYSCLLRNVFKSDSSRLKQRMLELWQHSTHVAALSYVLARETPGVDPERALLAGLIHDIGSVAVISGIRHFPVLAERDAVLDYCIESLRVEVGIAILRRWKLADEFEEVVRDAENWVRTGSAIPEDSDVVILAQMHALIGSPAKVRVPRIDTIPAFSKLVQGELSPRHSLTMLEEAEADVREIRAMISGA